MNIRDLFKDWQGQYEPVEIDWGAPVGAEILDPIPQHEFSQEFYRKMHELCSSIDPVTGEVHKETSEEILYPAPE